MEPPAPIKRIVELVDTARTVGPDGQVKAAQEIFRIWADNVYEIGTIGLTPMVQGVVVVNTQAPQRADDARQRLAAAEPGQRPPRAVLLHEVAACPPRPVPPARAGPGAAGRPPSSRSPPAGHPSDTDAVASTTGRIAMTRYVLQRLVLLPLLLFVFSVVVFAIVQAPPGDFLTAYMATLASSGSSISAEQIEALRQRVRARPAAPRPVLAVDGERPAGATSACRSSTSGPTRS